MVKQAFFVLFAVLLCSSVVLGGAYSGGTGEPNDPYLISTAEDLNSIGLDSNDLDKHFLLINNIDLSAYTGTKFNIIGYWETWYGGTKKPFDGVFDGNDHTITNFTYHTLGRNGVGLFAYLGTNSQIKNLELQDADVNAPNNYVVGALVGYTKGTVSNCHVTGNVKGNRYTGGMAGQNAEGSISDCSFQGSVNTTNYLTGGLVGYNEGLIENCYTSGTVEDGDIIGGLVAENHGLITNCYSDANIHGEWIVAGLVAINHYGTISTSFAAGDVIGEFSIGGFVGDNSGVDDLITNCYATGDVSGGSCVGGFAGRNYAILQNCYSTGQVTGSGNVGGLVGTTYGFDYIACFWDSGINPDVNGIGNASDPNVIGKTTAEMQTAATFINAGWDFNTPIWTIDGGVDYPRLWWEVVAGPVELTDELMEDVLELSLPEGISNSLLVKVDSALKVLEDDNENNDAAAVNSLRAFINAVNAQRGKKISETDAEALIAAAQQIIDLLGNQ